MPRLVLPWQMLLALLVGSPSMAPPSIRVAPAPARAPPIRQGALALGFDFGTSGARCALVDATGTSKGSPGGPTGDGAQLTNRSLGSLTNRSPLKYLDSARGLEGGINARAARDRVSFYSGPASAVYKPSECAIL